MNDVDARHDADFPLPASALDWNAVRLFLAVARAGSLTLAAGRTGLSQPTLGRRIDALEAQLGTTLFLRGRRGVVLTDAGADLLVRAEAMAAEADAFQRAATGRKTVPAGDVRITASRVVSTYLLPPILTALGQSDPQIHIDVVASDEVANLLRRDADIAVRMVRPTQPELIARKIGELRLGAFAAPSYVQAHGLPEPEAQSLLSHRLLGYDRSTLILDGLRAAGLQTTRDAFALRTDDQIVYAHLLASGAGIGFSPVALARRQGLIPVPLPVPIPPLPVWLVAHRDLRTNAAVRRVSDVIARGLTRALQSKEAAPEPR
ncbi:LysR family transcriptional regulator [Pseudooceanicola sp. CBS1P-1]|uniref:LysR family transcriptional regulator n=1 Tax=Pseudooceanicola albus TaxID=2692189 RepID=A0A6L7G5L4_9RHOB|nr:MULTISPECIES: LysR family transcriptional regulator [Pseudooceanicola]MBT9383001.1 LysR family transcriptional regulator [Pseudooceanicola endophyticus]MXN19189.1 LysR family transcriptional regulator [Pseudooceanicola albus]